MSSTVTLKVESVVCRMLRVYDSPRLCHSLTRAVSAHVPKCGKEILREWVDATTYPVACPLPSQAENPLPRDLGCCTQQVLVSIHVYVLLMLMLYVIQIDSLLLFLTLTNFGTLTCGLFFTCVGEGCTRRRRGAASLSEVMGESLPSFS